MSENNKLSINEIIRKALWNARENDYEEKLKWLTDEELADDLLKNDADLQIWFENLTRQIYTTYEIKRTLVKRVHSQRLLTGWLYNE